MTIRYRLLLAFLAIVLLAAGGAVILLSRFEGSLRTALGADQETRVQFLMATIDRDLFHRIELLQELLLANPDIERLLESSNQEFEQLEEIEPELERRDALWSASSVEGAELIRSVHEEPVSQVLRDIQSFYRERYGYSVFGELFVTNRYGANAAATQRTSDYRQDDEGWWQQARQDGLYVGEVSFDESAGILALDLALRIDVEGELAGVAKAILDIEELRSRLQEFRQASQYESSLILLYDWRGQLLLEEGVDPEQPPAQVPSELLQQESGFLFEGGSSPRLLAQAESRGYRDQPGGRWRVVAQVDAEEVLSPIRKLQRTITIAGLAMLLVAAGLALYLSMSIARPIEQAAQITSRLAAGDLDLDIGATQRGEVGLLLGAMRSMVDNLGQAVAGMVSTSTRLSGISTRLVAVGERLAAGSDEQSSATQETSTAIEEMATSIRQVAGNSGQVAANLEEAASGVEEMATAVHSVAAKSRRLSQGVEHTMVTVREMLTSIEAVASNAARAQQQSQNAVSEATRGGEAVRSTVEGMRRISDAMHDIVEVVGKLDERSRRITEITSSIEEIAKQSHLLALNATVQAAHAGEHGRGFAAVAEEVGRLAERSAVAVKEIGTTLQEVQVEVRRALEVSEIGSRSVQSGSDTAIRAGDVLSSIAHATDALSAMMLEVRSATEEQVRATSGMSATFEEMRGLTAEVETAVQEQATSSERISQSIEAMHIMASEVSAATSEQSRGTEQVVLSIAEIATVAARNAETANQIAESSRELARESKELGEISTFFNLGTDEPESESEESSEPED